MTITTTNAMIIFLVLINADNDAEMIMMMVIVEMKISFVMHMINAVFKHTVFYSSNGDPASWLPLHCSYMSGNFNFICITSLSDIMLKRSKKYKQTIVHLFPTRYTRVLQQSTTAPLCRTSVRMVRVRTTLPRTGVSVTQDTCRTLPGKDASVSLESGV